MKARYRPLGVLFCLLVACAPTTRYVTKKCPVPVTAVVGDLFTGIALIVIGAIKLNADKWVAGSMWTAPGGALIGGAYVSEVSCMKRVP